MCFKKTIYFLLFFLSGTLISSYVLSFSDEPLPIAPEREDGLDELPYYSFGPGTNTVGVLVQEYQRTPASQAEIDPRAEKAFLEKVMRSKVGVKRFSKKRQMAKKYRQLKQKRLPARYKPEKRPKNVPSRLPKKK